MIKRCARCNRRRLIHAKGLCLSCYVFTHTDKEKQRKAKAKWEAKNPDYHKKYYQKHKIRLKRNQRDQDGSEIL